MTLVFSHVSYETNYEPIVSNQDTLYLNVSLQKKIESLPIYDFAEDGKPKVVFKSAKINIADYEFYEDK